MIRYPPTLTAHEKEHKAHSAPRHLRKIHLLIALLIGSVLLAGIRGPGKYSGFVFFDRWDNCLLFNGPYLMYVSEAVKETLRPYAGQSVEIQAHDVSQPVNPGDGRINRFTVLGPAPEKPGSVPVGGLELKALPSSGPGEALSLSVLMHNRQPFALALNPDWLGIAVLLYTGKQRGSGLLFDPSDGTSYAIVTRASAERGGGSEQITAAGMSKIYAWGIERLVPFGTSIQITAGETRTITVHLRLPPGSYQFVMGYSQSHDVLWGPCLASNAVSFEVEGTGQVRIR